MLDKKILYLTYDGLTDPLGQSQILPYILGLSKLGYQITLVSFEKRIAYRKNVDAIRNICGKNNIKWIPLGYTKNPPVLSTIRDVYVLRKKVRNIYKEEGFSIIHCRSYLTALIGLWAKRKWGIKFLFDMRGFWADERVDGNLWDLKNPLYRAIYKFFKEKEKQFFTESDYIVSLTFNAKEIITSDLGVTNKIAPIEVIPCCVDLDLFDLNKITCDDIKKKKIDLKINEGSKVLTYIGSIGTWYMLPEMLGFFKEWLMHFPESVFLFITNDQPDEILSKAMEAEVPLSNLRILKGKRSEMPLLTACSDYSIFFIKPVFSKKASSPTKQAEIMAMGKPVICNSFIGDTDYVVNKYNSGVVISGFSNSVYKCKIEEIKKTRFDSYEIKNGAQEFYSLENGVRKYNNIYLNLLDK